MYRTQTTNNACEVAEIGSAQYDEDEYDAAASDEKRAANSKVVRPVTRLTGVRRGVSRFEVLSLSNWFIGVPDGIRTRVIAVKGRCPRPG